MRCVVWLQVRGLEGLLCSVHLAPRANNNSNAHACRPRSDVGGSGTTTIAITTTSTASTHQRLNFSPSGASLL